MLLLWLSVDFSLMALRGFVHGSLSCFIDANVVASLIVLVFGFVFEGSLMLIWCFVVVSLRFI